MLDPKENQEQSGKPMINRLARYSAYLYLHFSNYFKKETGTTPVLYRRSGML